MSTWVTVQIKLLQVCFRSAIQCRQFSLATKTDLGDVMNTRFAGRKLVISLLVFLGVVLLGASIADAQTAATGALAGTVTDPQGRAVPNATVTATSLDTNQSRTATTGASGDYKFSLLPEGNYSLKFSGAGFKTSEVSSVTVNVTETSTANQSLEVGAVTQTVTVESSVETLQTESSTLGTTVTGTQIAALPMANGNYTEILSLSAGTNVAVDSKRVSLSWGVIDKTRRAVFPPHSKTVYRVVFHGSPSWATRLRD